MGWFVLSGALRERGRRHPCRNRMHSKTDPAHPDDIHHEPGWHRGNSQFGGGERSGKVVAMARSARLAAALPYRRGPAMAYFKLSLPEQINTYCFDYHSHFSGILPVRGKDPHDKRPSMQWLVAGAEFDGDEDRAALRLFDYALAFMADSGSNPFCRLASAGNKAVYERAECAAENIYVGCILLLDAHGTPPPAHSWAIDAAALYKTTRNSVIAPALAGDTPIDGELLKTVRYFNGKIYSSNKYTPFDDCYKMRGVFVKQFCGGDPAKYAVWEKQAKTNDEAGRIAKRALDRYHAWIHATLEYLKASGVKNTQMASTEDEIAALNVRVGRYNDDNRCNFKLLVHTPHQYMRDGDLGRYLRNKVLPFLSGNDCREVIGLDLLGAENKVGNYLELFEFLAAERAGLSGQFGERDARSRRFVVHIHCGEGSGFGADNRSLTGYCMYRVGMPGHAYFRRFTRYILASARAARQKQEDTPRPTRGTATPWGLFDALFNGGNALTSRGRLLHRFDISAPSAREQAAYNAKRNVMALAETLSSTPRDTRETWYDALAGADSPYAFRLGHDYYYRSYMAARFPRIAFDTNVGSNAITGASGLFASVESYRVNRGFRHLDGYIDTDVLQAAGNAVAYMGAETLTQAQVARFAEISRQRGPIYSVLDESETRDWIVSQIEAALGTLYEHSSKAHDLWYAFYKNLVAYTTGHDSLEPQRYQALIRVFALFQNWRSCLLGADGQGAEHTEVQDEFLRMLVLLAYSLLPAGISNANADLLDTLGNFVEEVASAYWLDTVGPVALPQSAWQALDLESIDGFKAPASVVALYRRPGARAGGI
jgi:hypothetical protein